MISPTRPDGFQLGSSSTSTLPHASSSSAITSADAGMASAAVAFVGSMRLAIPAIKASIHAGATNGSSSCSSQPRCLTGDASAWSTLRSKSRTSAVSP